MKTPYELLDVCLDATDIEIKQAYLQKVKENPPDRDQEQFQMLHDAYQAIKDSKARLSYDLFNLPAIDFDELLDQAFSNEAVVQIKPEQFIKLLQLSIDENVISNAIPYPKKS